ncbi:hypothetical protein JB92DRAFT_2833758 [Gautieria morchelliformis]|nr:hypothetical protein JB92DRAFT_2833758 [Gautieria morchelliformis]
MHWTLLQVFRCGKERLQVAGGFLLGGEIIFGSSPVYSTTLLKSCDTTPLHEATHAQNLYKTVSSSSFSGEIARPSWRYIYFKVGATQRVYQLECSKGKVGLIIFTRLKHKYRIYKFNTFLLHVHEAALQYDEFTDTTWSPDGQCLSSRVGYLDDYHVGRVFTGVPHAAAQAAVAVPRARDWAASVARPCPWDVVRIVYGLFRRRACACALSDTDSEAERAAGCSSSSEENVARGGAPHTQRPDGDGGVREPAKKKRRVMLTRVGDLDS